MRPIWFVSMLLAGCGVFLAGGPPIDPKVGAGATGVFMGRSGKPMAKARLILAEVVGDDEVTFAKVRLLAKAAPVLADEKGQFRFGAVAPGNYTLVYQPAGVTGPLPAEINIKSLVAVAKSILPLMRNVEVGASGQPFPDRQWGQGFTLLKGHTFYSEGPYMKIWNATVRRGATGPNLEVRRGILWQERLDENSRIQFTAWSY